MKSIPWKKEVYLCFVVFGIVSLSVFEQFSLYVL